MQQLRGIGAGEDVRVAGARAQRNGSGRGDVRCDGLGLCDHRAEGNAHDAARRPHRGDDRAPRHAVERHAACAAQTEAQCRGRVRGEAHLEESSPGHGCEEAPVGLGREPADRRTDLDRLENAAGAVVLGERPAFRSNDGAAIGHRAHRRPAAIPLVISLMAMDPPRFDSSRSLPEKTYAGVVRDNRANEHLFVRNASAGNGGDDGLEP